ncbi:MAG: phosphoglucomutase (alpha-D-glucose-1,6-bisphosphate-dependent) [candidate division KSB1 bacterium]|nr:phosphoglucomutase (alpha-D-glucose-1,6-bisphosphate-dependent) [candidate division KSB1 bacterium]
MSHHPLAGKHVPHSLLPDIPNLISLYYLEKPDPQNPKERVHFGTSGHRGTSLNRTFTETHVAAIVQAVCDYRKQAGINGPLFLAKDTHALSDAAFKTALEVLAANNIDVFIDEKLGFTPTPVVSHAILYYNRNRKNGFADGLIITPSHNPPEDGGIKYNPPNGGPADKTVTDIIEKRANEHIAEALRHVRRIPYNRALASDSVHRHDYISGYVGELSQVIRMDALRSANLALAADALGGSGLAYWERIAESYGLKIDRLNDYYDPTFRFMHLDHDGKIRMDCSSPYAMAGLIKLRENYDVAFGNDPDFDRHGIVTPHGGLMNPNHYLSVAIWYLFQHREQWSSNLMIGKTLVSSSMIDRIAQAIGRPVYEVPVGFKWFVSGLYEGWLGFAGEESAGASFLRLDGSVWSTDKDGIILALLAAEIRAVTGRDPAEIYEELENKFGVCIYRRKDVNAEMSQMQRLKHLSADDVPDETLAGESVIAKLTVAPGNRQPIEGLKVVAENGWFAARPSGTEPKYKIYAESFKGKEHLEQILEEAEDLIRRVLERK